VRVRRSAQPSGWGTMTGMDDGSGTTKGQRRGITEAAHLGDERTVLLGLLQRQRELADGSVGEEPAP
jgi:hypothetical protein